MLACSLALARSLSRSRWGSRSVSVRVLSQSLSVSCLCLRLSLSLSVPLSASSCSRRVCSSRSLAVASHLASCWRPISLARSLARAVARSLARSLARGTHTCSKHHAWAANKPGNYHPKPGNYPPNPGTTTRTRDCLLVWLVCVSVKPRCVWGVCLEHS